MLPLYLPLADDDGTAAGLIGLLSQKVFDYSGDERTEREPDPEHLPLIEAARSALIEGIIAESEDETLMDRYLAGEDIDLKVLIEDLETAVARGSFYPGARRRRARPGWARPSCSRSSRRPSPHRSSTRCRPSPRPTAHRRHR